MHILDGNSLLAQNIPQCLLDSWLPAVRKFSHGVNRPFLTAKNPHTQHGRFPSALAAPGACNTRFSGGPTVPFSILVSGVPGPQALRFHPG